MSDEANYPNAMEFDAYRFVSDSNTGSMTSFTNVKTKFPIWGFGMRAWCVFTVEFHTQCNQHGGLAMRRRPLSLKLSKLTLFYFPSPGRFYAAHTEKTIIVHIIHNYDMRFAGDGATKVALSYSWRSAMIPFSSTQLQFRNRQEA